MARNDFNVSVRATLNTKDIPEQLQRLNTQLVKQTNTTIKIPVQVEIKDKDGTSHIETQFKERIKQVSLLKDEYGRLYQHIVQLNKTNGLPIKGTEQIKTITDKVQTLSTEIHKWTDTKGAVQTWTTTVDSEGNKITTRVKEMVTGLGQITTETTKWGRKTIEVNGQLKNVYGQLGDAQKKVTEFTTQMNTTVTQSKGVIHEAGQEFETLVTTTIKAGTSGEYLKTVVTEYTDAEGYAVKTTEQLNKANEQVATTQTTRTKKLEDSTKATKDNTSATEQNAKAHQTLGQSLSNAFTQLAKYYVASLPLLAFRKAITETITAVKEFDAAITEMGKVSDYSGTQLRKYTEDLGKLGKEVARTRTEMTEAATGWLKAGYSEEDAAKLAKYSSLLQNTADEELSAAEATSILVSQLKAYHMEADEAIKVTDIINAVSAEQAVSSYDLSQGLTVASASMATFGNSIEETTALLTAGTTIFQGRASQVARGLNMIATRVAKNEDALAKYDVSIKDSNGELRSTYDILSDLSPKWEQMSKAEQVALGNTLAG